MCLHKFHITQKFFQVEINEYYILETNKELLESIIIKCIRKELTQSLI